MQLNETGSVQEIRMLEKKLIKVMLSGDLIFLEHIFSDNYVFLGSDGSVRDKKKALDDYMNPEYNLLKLKIKNRKIFMHTDSAIVTGDSIVEGRIGKTQLTGKYRFIRVWNKEKDGWKIIAATTINKENAINV